MFGYHKDHDTEKKIVLVEEFLQISAALRNEPTGDKPPLTVKIEDKVRTTLAGAWAKHLGRKDAKRNGLLVDAEGRGYITGEEFIRQAEALDNSKIYTFLMDNQYGARSIDIRAFETAKDYTGQDLTRAVKRAPKVTA